MKINFILLALMSLFLTALGNSNGGGPYVNHCELCTDDYDDCVSVSISSKSFRKPE
jgi:hypothetical protein